MKMNKIAKLLLGCSAVFVFLMGLSFGFWDDIRECGTDANVGIRQQDRMADAELLRLSLKMCDYYSGGYADEAVLRPLLAEALASPAKAQQVSLDMMDMWMRHAPSRSRYDALCREVATHWMLRAAQGGEAAAHLMLALHCGCLVHVEGLSTEEKDKQALQRLEGKAKLSLAELDVLTMCYSRGVGTAPDDQKARDYNARANEERERLQQQR